MPPLYHAIFARRDIHDQEVIVRVRLHTVRRDHEAHRGKDHTDAARLDHLGCEKRQIRELTC